MSLVATFLVGLWILKYKIFPWHKLIFGAVLVFAVRYSRKKRQGIPEPFEGHHGLEAAWTIIPFIIVMVMFAWGAKLFFVASTPPDDAMPVYVVGKQWMWKIQHPDGRREINELHVPVGQAVNFKRAIGQVVGHLGFEAAVF